LQKTYDLQNQRNVVPALATGTRIASSSFFCLPAQDVNCLKPKLPLQRQMTLTEKKLQSIMQEAAAESWRLAAASTSKENLDKDTSQL
jgi:hypothetical protein